MISECCYAEDRPINLDGPMWSEIQICPVCRDNAVFVEDKMNELSGTIHVEKNFIHFLMGR